MSSDNQTEEQKKPATPTSELSFASPTAQAKEDLKWWKHAQGEYPEFSYISMGKFNLASPDKEVDELIMYTSKKQGPSPTSAQFRDYKSQFDVVDRLLGR
jgi:hypothetical protein